MAKSKYDFTPDAEELEDCLIALNDAKQLIRTIVEKDLRCDIVWLSHTRHVYGYLSNAIDELSDALRTGKERGFMKLGEDKD